MTTIQAVSSILVIIQAILTFFILMRDPDQYRPQNSEEKTKVNKSAARYQSFDFKTTITSILIFAITIVLIVFLLPINHSSFVHSEIIMSFLAVVSILSTIYVFTGNYRDFAALKTLFDISKPVSMASFSNASVLIGSISMLITSRFELIMSKALSSDLFSQCIRIGYNIFVIFIFLYLTASITIEIVYICKKHNVNAKILNKHNELNIWLYSHIPSRSYIRKYHKWKPSKKQYWSFFIRDCIYKFLLNIPFFLENVIVGTYKAIIAFLKTLSSLLEIHYKSDDICASGSYKRLLGWCLIMSLTITFFIINNSAFYSSNIKESYSFVAGIVIIPTIIGSIITRAK